MITLINYGVGNINAFVNVYKRLNIPTKVASKVSDLTDVEKLILPGVGSFDYAMNQLNASGMRERLDELVLQDKKPVIGICVGMQMMANYSEEGKVEGLKWIDATVRKFDESKIKSHTKFPHMGWNDVLTKGNSSLFKGLEKDSLFYFLHSYYFECSQPSDAIGTSDYGEEFCCAVNRDNIYGIQFHPEKSHHYGETLLNNFALI
jgi:glutamine amidotransferase